VRNAGHAREKEVLLLSVIKGGITMCDLHPNTIWLMAWNDRMVAKYGNPPGEDWCRKLAYFMGEAGNDHPSNEALRVARIWEIDNTTIHGTEKPGP